jgi:hypothetical protein
MLYDVLGKASCWDEEREVVQAADFLIAEENCAAAVVSQNWQSVDNLTDLRGFSRRSRIRQDR